MDLFSVTNTTGVAVTGLSLQITYPGYSTPPHVINESLSANPLAPGQTLFFNSDGSVTETGSSSLGVTEFVVPVGRYPEDPQNVQVTGSWSAGGKQAPEPLSVLGAVAAVGFGVALKRLKPKAHGV